MLLQFTESVWIDSESVESIEIVQMDIHSKTKTLFITNKSGTNIQIPDTDPKYTTVLKFLEQTKSIEDYL
jgi:hypothetical protein